MCTVYACALVCMFVAFMHKTDFLDCLAFLQFEKTNGTIKQYQIKKAT